MEKAKTQQSYKHNLLNEYLLHRNTTEKAKHRSIKIALIKKGNVENFSYGTLPYSINLTQPKGLKKFRWSLRRPGNTTSNEDFMDSNGVQPRQKPTYLLEK